MDLAGQVAIVTGASRGVGAATAVALASERRARGVRGARPGATPFPSRHDRRHRAPDRGRGRRAIAVPTNLAVGAEVEAMVATTEKQLGPVDILVNNAAITFPGDLDLPMKRFDLIFAVDLRAPVIATQAVVPGMIERGVGAIVNVSSAAALNAYPGQMAYGMASALGATSPSSLAEAAAATRHPGQHVPHRRAGRVGRLRRRSTCPTSTTPTGNRRRSRPRDPLDARAARQLHGHNVGMARLRAEHGIVPARASRPHTQAAGMVTESPGS